MYTIDSGIPIGYTIQTMAKKSSQRDAVVGFAEKLKAHRLARDWRQRELAERAGTTQASIADLERGLRQPSLSLALRLARALEVPITDLIPPQPRRRRKSTAPDSSPPAPEAPP